VNSLNRILVVAENHEGLRDAIAKASLLEHYSGAEIEITTVISHAICTSNGEISIGACIREEQQQLKELNAFFQKEQPQHQIPLKRGSATVIVDTEHIGYLEAIVGYSRIHLNKTGQQIHKIDSFISDASLEHLHNQLPQERFSRIHRSVIVNLEQVIAYYSEKRRMFIKLKEFDTTIPVSRRQMAWVRENWPAI